MTVTVIAILASMAIPNYSRAIRRAQGQAARDVLLTLYAGEKARQAAGGVYVFVGCCFNDPNDCFPAGGGLPACATEWGQVFMDNPHVNSPPIRFHTTTPPPGGTDPTTMVATAKWNPTGDVFMQIDQTGVITCPLGNTGLLADKQEYGCFP